MKILITGSSDLIYSEAVAYFDALEHDLSRQQPIDDFDINAMGTSTC